MFDFLKKKKQKNTYLQNGSVDYGASFEKQAYSPQQQYMPRTEQGSAAPLRYNETQEQSASGSYFTSAPHLTSEQLPAMEKESIRAENSYGADINTKSWEDGLNLDEKLFWGVEEKKNTESNSTVCDENFARYAGFKEKRDILAKILGKASVIMNELNMERFTDRLKMLSEKVEKDAFRVQIVGTFKNGKSTFINSFLREEVLPAYALPCTAVINEVKYGAEKRAILHFKNPIPDVLPKELSRKALEHMQNYSMKEIPPMEIPYNEIEDYVVIPMGKDPKDMLLESPYEKVELYWPLDILKNGIEIVDSPGLNEHATRTKVTMDYISKADAVVFVLSATTLCSQDEMSFIENNLKTQGFEDLFFVINRFDLIEEKERARIVQYAKSNLVPFTSFGEDGLFFVSAKDALDSRKTADFQKLQNSGMPVFEKALSEFLTVQRGKLKLISTAKRLSSILQDDVIGKIIPRQKDMLETSVDVLKDKYNQIMPKLNALEVKKNSLYQKIISNIEESNKAFYEEAIKYINEITGFVPVWINNYKPVAKMGLIPTKGKAKAIVDEISAFMAVRLERSNAIWQESVLEKMMKNRAIDVFKTAENELKSLMSEIHQAGEILSNKVIESGIDSYELEYYHSYYGITGDNVSLNKEVTRQIAGKTLVIMLSFVNPVALISVLTAMFVGSSNGNDSALVVKLKESVIKEVTQSLHRSSGQFAKSVIKGIDESYMGIANNMMSPINAEISEIQQQIESAINDMEQGESVAKERIDRIMDSEAKIKNLCHELDKFIRSTSR